jgi:hypothetical protein
MSQGGNIVTGIPAQARFHNHPRYRRYLLTGAESTNTLLTATAQENSVDFGGNGSAERMSTDSKTSGSGDTLGFGNAWTCMAWCRWNGGSGTVNRYVTTVGNADAGPNDVRNSAIQIRSTASEFVRVEVWDDASPNALSSPEKEYISSTAVVVLNTWLQIVVTWDGSNLLLYFDSVLDTPTVNRNEAVLQVNRSDRIIHVGQNINTNAEKWDGEIYQVAYWDTDLNQNSITEIYNSGNPKTVNLLGAGSSYNKAANLQHWYRMGLDNASATAMGTDYATAGTPLDLSEHNNISPSPTPGGDRSPEFPGV